LKSSGQELFSYNSTKIHVVTIDTLVLLYSLWVKLKKISPAMMCWQLKKPQATHIN